MSGEGRVKKPKPVRAWAVVCPKTSEIDPGTVYPNKRGASDFAACEKDRVIPVVVIPADYVCAPDFHAFSEVGSEFRWCSRCGQLRVYGMNDKEVILDPSALKVSRRGRRRG